MTMGLSRAALKMLLDEARQRPLSGSLLTLGRQDVLFDYECLERTAASFDFSLKPVERIELAPPPAGEQGCIRDTTLFRSLGFSDVQALDFSDYESADVILDLNQPETPSEYCGAFDTILDAGTTEHVFHLPNALQHVARMLREGGRAIHIAPSSNHLDHGFYMFSPTLFRDWYAANGFALETVQLIRYWPDYDDQPWEMFDYEPGVLDRLSFGGLDDAMYGVLCIATRSPGATCDRVPQQSAYERAWQDASSSPRRTRRERGPLRRVIRGARKAVLRAIRAPLKAWHRRRGLQRINLKPTRRY